MAVSTVSSTLGIHGAPLTVEHEGKVYSATPITQKVKSAFERWLTRRVLAPAQELASQDSSLAPAVQVVLDRIEAGHYSFHGPTALGAIRTPDGILCLTSLLFGISEDEAMTLTVGKPVEVGNIIAQLVRESFPQAKGQDPNVPGPATV